MSSYVFFSRFRHGTPKSKTRGGRYLRNLPPLVYFLPNRKFRILLPILRSRPCWVMGMPVEQDTRCFTCVMPKARRHENDSPGIFILNHFGLTSCQSSRAQRTSEERPMIISKSSQPSGCAALCSIGSTLKKL